MTEVNRKLTAGYKVFAIDSPCKGHIVSYQDDEVPYLRLRVTSRSRNWYIDLYHGGKHFKSKIGGAIENTVDMARRKAQAIKNNMDLGIPIPPAEPAAMTVGECFEKYYKSHLKYHASTHRDCLRYFELYWAAIENHHASSLFPALLRDWLDCIAEKHGKATANKQRTLLQAALRFCSSQELITFKPSLFLSVKSFRMKKSIQYLHQGDEVTRLMSALTLASKDVHDAIMLLLLTGQRKMNVLSMEFGEIDFDNYTWHIPATKTKTGTQYSIALTPKAVEVIKSRMPPQCKAWFYVFPRTLDRSQHIVNIDAAWRHVRERAGLPHLRLHDLRHTVATWLAQSGAQAFEIQAAMQHSSVATSQKYVHLAADGARERLSKIQSAIW